MEVLDIIQKQNNVKKINKNNFNSELELLKIELRIQKIKNKLQYGKN